MVCKVAQRDREASLDRCAGRTRAGFESAGAKQGRQKTKATSGARLPLSSRNSISATPRQGTPLHEPRVSRAWLLILGFTENIS
jgi:hypothetical protein